ncbi:hypothetical protein BH09ACT10_BH09ACT10_17000 [soil metagenome]
MHGLTVRWSLAGTSADKLDELKAYVRDESYERFLGLDGLRFKTWRARDGEWFEGCYVFATSEARDAFETGFRVAAQDGAASKRIGSAPVLIEACEIVSVVEGPEKFLSAPSY